MAIRTASIPDHPDGIGIELFSFSLRTSRLEQSGR